MRTMTRTLIPHLLFLPFVFAVASIAQPTEEVIGEHTVHRLELDNGLRVLALNGSNDTADVYLAVGTGKRHESRQNAGIAHLVEHALFTGTPTTGPQQFEKIVEDWGGRANAYARDDYTLYYDVDIPAERLPELLAMEADRMQNLSFEPAAFAFEQERLRKEEAGTFTFQMEVGAITDALAYPNHPYGSGLLTNRHTRAPWLPLDSVRRFYQEQYRADNIAVVIVSPNHKQALAAASKAFGALPAAAERTTNPAKLRLPRLRVASSHTLERPVTDAVHLTVHRLPPLNPDTTPELVPQLDLLGLLLERYAASAVDKNVPPLRIAMNTRLDGGILVVKSAAAPDDATLQALANLPISTNELAATKALVRDTIAELPLHSRPYFSLGAELAASEVMGLGALPGRYAELIDAITAEQLRALAARVLDPATRVRIHIRPDGTREAEALPKKPADLADYADRAQAEGRLDDAIRAYTKLFGMTKSHMYKVIYLTTRGQLHVENKDYPAGIADFKQALALSDYPAIKPLLADAEDRLAKQMARGERGEAASDPTSVVSNQVSEAVGPQRERDMAAEKELADQRAELERLIPEISKQIEDWRGLKFTQPVTVTFTNVTESEDLAGFYDSETKQLVVKVHRGRPRFSRGVLLHELVHALQDQHFDLLGQHKAAEKHGVDAQRSLSCLIEGVAILAVADLMKYDFAAHSDLGKAKGEIDDARFDKLYTYGQGYSFVKHLMGPENDWDNIAAAWKNPPRRTLEILDPDRYLEPPRGDGSAGAYDLVRLLADKEDTRGKALNAARLLEFAEHDKKAEDKVVFTFEGPDEATAVQRLLPDAVVSGSTLVK